MLLPACPTPLAAHLRSIWVGAWPPHTAATLGALQWACSLALLNTQAPPCITCGEHSTTRAIWATDRGSGGQTSGDHNQPATGPVGSQPTRLSTAMHPPATARRTLRLQTRAHPTAVHTPGGPATELPTQLVNFFWSSKKGPRQTCYMPCCTLCPAL